MTQSGLDIRVEGFRSDSHFANSGLLLARYNCEKSSDCRRISVYCMGPNYAHLDHRDILDAFKIPSEKVVGGAEFDLKNKVLSLSGGSDEFGNIPESVAWHIAQKLKTYFTQINHSIIYAQVSGIAQGIPNKKDRKIPENVHKRIIENGKAWQRLGFPLQTSL